MGRVVLIVDVALGLDFDGDRVMEIFKVLQSLLAAVATRVLHVGPQAIRIAKERVKRTGKCD
jgi:hypothetical protein